MAGTPAADPTARFLSRTMLEPNSGCWLWIGADGPRGYGRFSYRGQWFLAHRFSYELFSGAIPDDLFICHRCDTRLCVNPDHLFLGTHADNLADMARKGRGRKPGTGAVGERCRHAKLTADQVRELRRLRAEGARPVDISRAHGIPIATLEHILARRTWKHV